MFCVPHSSLIAQVLFCEFDRQATGQATSVSLLNASWPIETLEAGKVQVNCLDIGASCRAESLVLGKEDGSIEVYHFWER